MPPGGSTVESSRLATIDFSDDLSNVGLIFQQGSTGRILRKSVGSGLQ